MLRPLLTCLVATACLAMTSPNTGADDPPTTREQLLRTFVDELVPITPGQGDFPASFQMGSADGPAAERPVHEVTFDYDFSIAKYEVPQNLYEVVMGENPSRWKGPRNSAEMMNWREAASFCERLTALLREAGLIEDDEEIRLPSEAEWEYCCRAGTKTAYSFGDQARAAGDEENQATLLDEYAWHTGNAAGNDPPVGALKPNPWGLYDVHGYLWEFCSDRWQPDHDAAPGDGSARREGAAEQIVIRGGSWKDRFTDLRSSTRKPFARDGKDDAVGFRCVRAGIR